ncbi:hypothetical protein [Microbulbifer spongiae]|uniref:DOMON domain-containing protein n=1 Tax=Microbulbifer spongiae TaxID=2944933 RepID=A0ABY9EGH7_9GAMM|nr:hypothetical protein [Microbulbifer sp. MI-G]WKD50794.1 hypothetical protein M8T91_05045 [Microbulbifer sp. MI-G]
MPTYTLNIDFCKQDLDTLYKAGEKVTLIKQSSNGQPVAWVAFYPFENNTVIWEQEYALYASTTQIEGGATIHKMSDDMAQEQMMYAFQNGNFGTPHASSQLSEGQYGVANQTPIDQAAGLTFGLAQSVQVNGSAYPNKPINADWVPSKHVATFTPYENIMLFMNNNIQDGMVVTEIFSPSLTLTFGGATTELTANYNAATGRFAQA